MSDARLPNYEAAVTPYLPTEGRVIQQAFTSTSANVQLTASNKLGANARQKVIGLCATQDCHILMCNAAADAVTATTGVLLKAGEKFYGYMQPGFEFLAVIRDSADGSLDIWIASP